MRAELCRAHVEFAQPDGRIGGIESHEAIVQEGRGKEKPGKRRIPQVICFYLLYMQPL
jgi:hypothetical protein